MKKLVLLLGIIVFFWPTTLFAANTDEINQRVCNRFEEDINRLAAIMEEVKFRKGILETTVAFGQIDTPIKSADYWVTFTAEAIAFQRAQSYSSKSELRSSLIVLRNKLVKAKNEVEKVLNE